jgi:HSP20 family molecular chaperone IbpA
MAAGSHDVNDGNFRDWMWSEALDMLARAERLQRQVFQPRGPARAQPVCWEPPSDMFETAQEVIVVVALPGVEPEAVQVTIDSGMLEVFAQRSLPRGLNSAAIHRLELPQGCFQRRLQLPPGSYRNIRHSLENGCLIVVMQKS